MGVEDPVVMEGIVGVGLVATVGIAGEEGLVALAVIVEVEDQVAMGDIMVAMEGVEDIAGIMVGMAGIMVGMAGSFPDYL